MIRTTSAAIRRITTIGLAGLLLAGLALTASAHETREVEGEFQFVVGFMDEPAYVDQINGIDLRITRLGNGDDHDNEDSDHDHGGGAPVENAHQTLRAIIHHGDETMNVDLRAVWGQPGAYTADVIPTETGTYSFQFIGEIDGVEIDETFRGGPDSFSEVEPRDELEFPAASAALDTDSNQMAAIGIAGVVAGLLGLLAGGVAYFKVTNPGGRKNPAQERREARQAQQQQSQQQE